MEGTLFTPGFLGAHFSWWIGQIPQDGVWRENIIPGKHESSEQNVGWGYRYKVSIIGCHDQEVGEEEDNELPWAQVMYPITAGGGQSASYQTPNIRQGNFVFGFYMDNDDQQVPVIMGILGNNQQTKLGTKPKNYKPTSGYATGDDPDLNIKPPDEDQPITKPQGVQTPQKLDPPDICSPSAEDLKRNKYGLRPDRRLNSAQQFDANTARNLLDNDDVFKGYTPEQKNDFVQNAVREGIKRRCGAKNSPDAPAEGYPSMESTAGVHQQSVADVKKQDRYLRKIPKQDPYDPIGSSMRSMQIVLENLTKDINKVLQTALAYVDAVTNTLDSIDDLICKAAEQLAKYMKTLFDKMLEYILKQIQTAMAPASNLLFPNQRYMFSDLKEQITKLITCLFEKIIEGLIKQIKGAMKNGGDGSKGSGKFAVGGGTGTRGEAVDEYTPTPCDKTPHVQMCYVENLAGDIIAANREPIEQALNRIVTQVDNFLFDQKNQLDVISGGLSSDSTIPPSLGGIAGNMASALSFTNMSFNLFGCDFSPTAALSDFYRLQNGGGSGETADKGRIAQVGVQAAGSAVTPKGDELAFATPEKNHEDLAVNSSQTRSATAEEERDYYSSQGDKDEGSDDGDFVMY